MRQWNKIRSLSGAPFDGRTDPTPSPVKRKSRTVRPNRRPVSRPMFAKHYNREQRRLFDTGLHRFFTFQPEAFAQFCREAKVNPAALRVKRLKHFRDPELFPLSAAPANLRQLIQAWHGDQP